MDDATHSALRLLCQVAICKKLRGQFNGSSSWIEVFSTGNYCVQLTQTSWHSWPLVNLTHKCITAQPCFLSCLPSRSQVISQYKTVLGTHSRSLWVLKRLGSPTFLTLTSGAHNLSCRLEFAPLHTCLCLWCMFYCLQYASVFTAAENVSLPMTSQPPIVPSLSFS